MVRILMQFICTFTLFTMKPLKAGLAIPLSLLVAPAPLPSTGHSFYPLPSRETMLCTCSKSDSCPRLEPQSFPARREPE